jgi:hypothetical protein
LIASVRGRLADLALGQELLLLKPLLQLSKQRYGMLGSLGL